ncbi:MAG: hypothetical protein MZW92_67725 [Comamonadaceae bacterium]|nr:hypothetical protein [Comamonadaceae bacterium]
MAARARPYPLEPRRAAELASRRPARPPCRRAAGGARTGRDRTVALPSPRRRRCGGSFAEPPDLCLSGARTLLYAARCAPTRW